MASSRFFLFVFSAFFLHAASGVVVPPVLAANDSVDAITENGTVILNSGLKIQLAGLSVPPESIPILNSLLRRREVQIKYDKSLNSGDAETPKSAYVFVETRQSSMPIKERSGPRKKRVMVNELLLSMGAARVSENLVFKKKKDFLEIEKIAQTKGEGIWSYETPGEMKK
ncbi:MAG: thermonuclease family protein [Candidatus Omnitrophica bacterium]|nr:thermonuclease family protein [Candidatus Omnitrophota bacterium]